jgi:hypothetical protein
VRVRHLRVVERPHDVDDRVDVAHVAEEAVAETLALVRPAHEPGDVHELDVLGDAARDPQGVAHGVEALVGDRDDRDVRLDGRERVLSRLRAGAGQRVEERRLARVRQPDDPDLHRKRASAGRAARASAAPSRAPTTTSDG